MCRAALDVVTKCVGIFTSKPKFRALIEGAVHDTGADSLMGTNPYDGLPSCMLSAVRLKSLSRQVMVVPRCPCAVTSLSLARSTLARSTLVRSADRAGGALDPGSHRIAWQLQCVQGLGRQLCSLGGRPGKGGALGTPYPGI